MQFLVRKKRIELNAFVIMPNHLHLIWQALQSFTPSQNQASFMKYKSRFYEMREDYHYSPARFYYDGTNSFGMLTHFSGN